MYQTRWVYVATALALSVAMVSAAEAQQRSTGPRGSAKVHSRLFNPFNVSGSQISVDRFGIVTYRGGSTLSTMSVTPYWASAAVFSAVLAPTAPVTTAASTAVAGASSVATLSVTPTSGSLEPATASADLAIGASVRPPYRPPVRSPFRPPPRPPFIP